MIPASALKCCIPATEIAWASSAAFRMAHRIAIAATQVQLKQDCESYFLH